MNLTTMMLISLMISNLLIILSKTFFKSKMKKKEESSNFECGFESQTSKNIFISGQFFMISMLFIIFDMEITLIIPIFLNDMASMKALWNMSLILLILILGTLLEWKAGLIEWAK